MVFSWQCWCSMEKVKRNVFVITYRDDHHEKLMLVSIKASRDFFPVREISIIRGTFLKNLQTTLPGGMA